MSLPKRGHVLFLLIFVTLGAARVNAAPIPLSLPSSDKSLACGQLRWVGLWSLQKFVSDAEMNLLAPAFAQRTAEAFAERLDPYRILFTEAEVAELKKVASTAWRSAFLAGDCARFSAWQKSVAEPARDRLEARLKALSMVSFKLAKEASADAPEIPRPKHFAKNEGELSARLSAVIEKIFSGATQSVLAAYRNDRMAFAQESLKQTLPSSDATVSELLAKSMLKAMDPYSTYLSNTEYAEFSDDLAGSTSGIGVQVRPVPAGLLVEKILADSPAQKNGKLREGDVITSVDGNEIAKVPVEKARDVLRGAPESKVELKVARGSQSHTLEFKVSLKRERFSFEEGTITHHSVDRGDSRVEVIEIPSFYGSGDSVPGLDDKGSCAKDLEKILTKVLAEKKKPDAIVLDLRQNPGGYLEEAIAMAGLFLGDLPVVGIIERNQRRTFRNPFAKARYTGPLVVLVDEESASASEVLAGALKDHHRALVVGTPRTYGKGTIQRLFHLEDEALFLTAGAHTADGVIKLTTSVFYSPLGHSPTGVGLKPHLLVRKKLGEVARPAERPNVRYATDVSPFLTGQELKRVRAENPRWASLLKDLESRHVERAKLAHNEVKAGAKSDTELDETIAITSDYLSLETPSQAVANTAPARDEKHHVATEAE